ncbi:oligosaccharide flippase family protein [Frondihabitans peucedani]|uniref:O-antigen/teichoic acid export membrane protein n=1 Tax=Frondihabitans peucedani TaxID=598626 RepID=A0ABP8E550_9MICO
MSIRRPGTRPAQGATTARHLLVTLLGNVFAPLAALATAPVMAHALGASGRGEVAAATAPLLLATSLAAFGIPSAITHFLAKHPVLRQRLAGRAALALVGAGLAVLVVVASLSGSLSGGDASVQRLVLIASLALVPSLLGMLLQAIAAGEQRWNLVAAERFVTAAARLAAFVLLGTAGRLDVTWSVVILAASPVLGALVYLPMLVRGGISAAVVDADRIPSLGARDLLGYGVRIWIGSVAGVLLLRLDQALIGPLAGVEVLGLYAVAATVADLPLVINSAVRDVLFSAQSAKADDGSLARAARLSTLFVTAVCVGLAAILPWALPVLFGADFTAAVPVCWVLLAGLILSNPGSIAGVGLSAVGRPGLRSLALSAACLVNVALVILLTPSFGALGAALATAVGGIVAGWLNVALLSRVSGARARDFFGIHSADMSVLVRLGARLPSRLRLA